MHHLREALHQVATDALCGRIGVSQFRVLSLELLQLLHHLVVHTIRDHRREKHVVRMVVLLQILP